MPRKRNQRGAPTMGAPLDPETREMLVEIEQRQTSIEQLLKDLSKQMVVMMESFEQMKVSYHTPISDSIPQSPIEEFVASNKTNDADDHADEVYYASDGEVSADHAAVGDDHADEVYYVSDGEVADDDHAAVGDDHATPAHETEPVKEKRAVRTNRKYKNDDYINLGFRRIHQRK